MGMSYLSCPEFGRNVLNFPGGRSLDVHEFRKSKENSNKVVMYNVLFILIYIHCDYIYTGLIFTLFTKESRF